jgi:hypothetical protein
MLKPDVHKPIDWMVFRMKKLAPLLLLVTMSGVLAGCVLVPMNRRASGSATAQCHPSQYWDGSQCRHKGQGHGARKHDGEGKGKGKGKHH